MFILEGGSISWCSKKEDCFSLSTIKSEYIACTAAVQEAIWLRNSLLCLDVTKHAYETTVIYCDNTAAILFFSTNIIPCHGLYKELTMISCQGKVCIGTRWLVRWAQTLFIPIPIVVVGPDYMPRPFIPRGDCAYGLSFLTLTRVFTISSKSGLVMPRILASAGKSGRTDSQAGGQASF